MMFLSKLWETTPHASHVLRALHFFFGASLYAPNMTGLKDGMKAFELGASTQQRRGYVHTTSVAPNSFDEVQMGQP